MYEIDECQMCHDTKQFPNNLLADKDIACGDIILGRKQRMIVFSDLIGEWKILSRKMVGYD
jgi:hypothetical protein